MLSSDFIQFYLSFIIRNAGIASRSTLLLVLLLGSLRPQLTLVLCLVREYGLAGQLQVWLFWLFFGFFLGLLFGIGFGVGLELEPEDFGHELFAFEVRPEVRIGLAKLKITMRRR